MVNFYRNAKYKAKKTTIGDTVFDSKKEAMRYCSLLELQRMNAISNLQRQVQYELQPSFRKNNQTYRAINYIADFVYIDNTTGKTVVEDVKGFKTDVYSIKKKLFEFKYSDLEIKEI